MIFLITDKNLNVTEIEHPIKFEMQKEIYVPYTSLDVTIPLRYNKIDVISIRVLNDTRKTIFFGSADKVTTYMNEKGRYLSIKARSKGAVLADNEAIPQTIASETSLMTYYDNYLKEYGISYKSYMDPMCLYNTRIYKGTSEWEALNIFMWSLRSKIADVNEEDVIVFVPELLSTSHVFSNSGEDSIKYSSIYYEDHREKRYSSIWAYSDTLGKYVSMAIDNTEVLEGTNRRRLFSFSQYDMDAKPVRCKLELAQFRAGTKNYVLRAPGYHSLLTWERASISDSNFGDRSDLFISRVKHVLDENGEYTEVELWPTSNIY